MKSLRESLINKNNIKKIRKFAKFVMVTDPDIQERVWMFLNKKEVQRRFSELCVNQHIKEYLNDPKMIGIWILPTPSRSFKFYARGSIGDIKEDFKKLVESRSYKVKVYELDIRKTIDPNMTITQFYQKERYFIDQCDNIKKEII